MVSGTTPLVAPAPVEIPSRGEPATHALIVEDQEYNVLVLDSILTRLGYQTDHAASGNDAWGKLRRNRYDIVFMDWDLPGMSGVEVTRLFRQWEPPGAHTPIVATTAYCTMEKQRDCLEAGMDGFVAKPLSPEKIRTTVRDLRSPCQQADSRDSPSAGVSPPLQIQANEEAPRQTLDLSIFRYLSDEQPDKLRQFAEKFVAGLDQDVALLIEAVRSGNIEHTRRQAHRILSQTALVSASRVAALVTAIQEAARKGDIETPRSALAAFEAEVDSLKRGLRSVLETS